MLEIQSNSCLKFWKRGNNSIKIWNQLNLHQNFPKKKFDKKKKINNKNSNHDQ